MLPPAALPNALLPSLCREFKIQSFVFDFDIYLFLQSFINSLNITEHCMSGPAVSTENKEMSKT